MFTDEETILVQKAIMIYSAIREGSIKLALKNGKVLNGASAILVESTGLLEELKSVRVKLGLDDNGWIDYKLGREIEHV